VPAARPSAPDTVDAPDASKEKEQKQEPTKEVTPDDEPAESAPIVPQQVVFLGFPRAY
jgi:hypothetical protein